jgi:ABC-type lipoprotein release transport system permease subunit
VTSAHLILRSLSHYWRINLAVIGGVATAVAVLAGALMVGDSVKASLRDLVLARLGKVDHVVLSTGFFREQLADDLRSRAAGEQAAPLIVLEGFVTDQASGRRASRVQVYGIDNRFWQFHGLDRIAAPEHNEALLSEGLANELAAHNGTVILRVESGSAIPTESVHGRKEDVGRTIRLTVRRVLPSTELGEFSLSPRQGAIRAIFVPLRRMQTVLQQPNRVNAMVIAGDSTDLERIVRESAQLEDLGLRLRVLPSRGSVALESESTILGDNIASVARVVASKLGMQVTPTLSYLANTIRVGDREIPYSVITALDLAALAPAFGTRPEDRLDIRSGDRGPESEAIVLNDWAARELHARVGDPVSIDYYVWETEGRLSTRRADFHVAAIVPIEGAAADPDLVPEYPGITDSARIADWDPPFPIDLRRIRPADEAYWNRYRATPKAFVAIETGQRLWRSRYGSLTAVRIRPSDSTPLPTARDRYGAALRAELDPLSSGFSVYNVRAQNLEASSGATDFGEYFTYFSTFLVVSALLLTALFFKLGVEQRLQEIGLLQALGLGPTAIRGLFLGEGLVLSILGGIAGVAAAVGYGAAIMLGLRTWWVDAVGTTALTLHVDPQSLILGASGGVLVAIAVIWWSLRALSGVSARSLLHGENEQKGVRPHFLPGPRPPFSLGASSAVLATLAVALLAGAAIGRVGRVAGFFGAGALSLIAMLCLAAMWLRAGRHRMIDGRGWWPVWRLGMRNATYRPARSVLCIALIAFATFVSVAVETFKRPDTGTALNRVSGTGGYPLVVESLLPIVHDLNSGAGRDALNLPTGSDLDNVRFDRFRVRPGDEASCLNLYQPKNPRIVAPSPEFVASGRFAFQGTIPGTSEAEAHNPWLLLNREFPDEAIPVIADANSMTYVLHRELGEEIVLPGASNQPVRLRFVAALSDSIFQGELLMAESNFVRTFPEWEGYRLFLVDAPLDRTNAVTELLETRLTDFGVDVGSTSERLAAFHRVEYTYLSTFQLLGGLGLVLGTLGLGAVLLRNVLERRRELALLRALGYGHADFFTIVIAENVLLLVCGLVGGTLCALIAIAPVFMDRSGRLPISTVGALLFVVLMTGLLASLAATVAAVRAPLLPALRAE